MKKLTLIFTLLFSIMALSQNFYEKKWKTIAENYQKGLYKSNLPIILEIQKQATKDGNSVELIRGLKAEFVIINQTQNDTENDVDSQFFKKIQIVQKDLKGKDKIVFQALTGEFISDYYDENSWDINDRTNLSTENSANEDLTLEQVLEVDIETWSKADFKNYLEKNYKDLKKSSPSLETISIQDYQSIFDNTKSINYFPTLRDWLTVNEINFLQGSQLFTPNELKVNQKKVETLYDELIANNTGNSKLYFQHQKLNNFCMLNKCKDRFEQLEKLVEDESTKGDYKVLIIEDIINLLVAKQDYKLALIWVNDAKEMFPKSEFINNIINKENQIRNPSLQIHYEQNVISNLPIHVVPDAKNLTQFSLKIYSVNNDLENFLKYSRNSYDKGLYKAIKKDLVREENYSLPEFSDYKNHKTSVEIKPLPSGIYIVEYLVNKEKVEDFYFIASNSRILTEKKYDDESKPDLLKMVNRENGKSIANSDLVFYKMDNSQLITKHSGKTDANGNFQYPLISDNDYYQYFLVHQPATNDFQIISFYRNNYRNNYNEDKNKNIAQIFLDRAIYRPGQIVYFKVINTKLVGDVESVNTNVSQEITLRDANGDEASKQTFTTNEFGSYNGSFTLPKGKLNGQFYISIKGKEVEGYKYFQVEEYKRPKFEITFEPIKEEYKYGQTVELKGTAKMFSGVSLSDTTINYEIKKQDIRWKYFWWYPQNNDNQNSILGEVKTNEKGEFTIKIKLEKDETLEGIQVDNYQIEASATDINGETQTATTDLKVASVSHFISINNIKKENFFTDEKIEFTVQTKNYNDQNLNKPFHAKLSKLTSEDRVFRDNFKDQIQDAPQFSKSEFIKKFPHDYFNKDEKEEKVEKIILESVIQNGAKRSEEFQSRDFSSREMTEGSLNLGKLPAGKYELELYNIEGKDTIKTKKSFEVFDKRFLVDSQKTFLKVISEKAEYSRNETGKIFIYSAIPDALVNVFVQNGDGETITEQKKLKNGSLLYEVKFPESEKVASMNIQVQLVAYNDVKTETVDLQIKSETKPLKIETIVFRDKLQPGAKEKWTIKILGDQKEKVQAEVLANMYDQSLDQFAINNYSWQTLKNNFSRFNGYSISERLEQESFQKRLPYFPRIGVDFPNFRWNDYSYLSSLVKAKLENRPNVSFLDSLQGEAAGLQKDSSRTNEINEVVVHGYSKTATAPSDTDADGMLDKDDALIDIGSPDLSKIKVRENLNETAFFYPNLVTDKDGNVNFEFTSPEALTKWKVMFLAHTKDARSAYLEKSVVTQKEFSVTPNYPRFLREGDELQLQAKLSSLVDKPLNGTAQLQILDAFTNEDISAKFLNTNNTNSFELNKLGNAVVSWRVNVPKDVSSIVIKVVAKAGDFSDGEQKAIAVLPNRMLVTDAVPIFVKEGQTKTFSIENLVKNTSTTAQNFSNTLELTTNPIWEIMFALPSLKTDDNQSSDVVFNKWFADVVASEIFKANPKMKTIFEEYQSKGLLTSNLEKNQELKQLLLEETPWVLESKNEEEQMQKLARLFEVNSMKNSIQNDWKELQQLQNGDGGFSWYKGYQSSYYNSLYILKNLGKLNLWLKGNTADYQSTEQKQMVAKLVNYVDNEVNKYYENPTSLNASKKNIVNNYVLDYLDSRNYWEKEYPLSQKGKTLKNAVIAKAKTEKITDFTFFGLHRLALLFNDYGEKEISKKFLTYLKETSTDTENQGVYWKQNLNDWGWYSSKTINHAGALEAFQQLTPNDIQFIEEMKIWLITQKEVNSWGNSRTTAEVIFTILNSGKSWTKNSSDEISGKWGTQDLNAIAPSPLEKVGMRTTGYVKSTIKSENLNKNLGTVTITKPGAGIVQGGLFWQYYEDLDKIKSSESYISITKELYRKVKTVNGEELQKISENSPLKIGDKVTVRMILNTDRNMEFIHLKDMRAAGFEPLNVISGYEWKNNLGYYQSTKDASTNFYIQYMPKGKYVFEYDYICNAAGTFSNGITTLQNYYAPQMNAHTKGTSIEISE